MVSIQSFKHPEKLTPTRIVLDPQHRISNEPVSKLIYAGFIEHVGRCIYGGVVDDPKNPSPDKLLEKQDEGDAISKGRLGWRKDVLNTFKTELEMPMLRWPGGNFVSNYHWQDGIGPVDERPTRIELAWLSDESNKFGTNEFIDYCRAVDSEPYICLNMGSGTFEEALAWLEYCNGTGNTHWANLRRKHTGRQEPHNVKYWGLGNEVWGPWQVGNQKAADYAEKARQWAHALKLVDPTIKLVSCGHEGNDAWDSTVLDVLAPYVDLHSIHFYSTLGHEKVPEVKEYAYENNVFGPAAAEKSIEICRSYIDKANIERATQKLPPHNLKIAYDEWNVWDEVKAPGAKGLEQTYDFTDMLGFVAWLHVLLRKHEDMGLACLAQSVNVIAPIMTSPDGLVRQTIYYPLRAFSKYMKDGYLLNLPQLPDKYTGTTYPLWIHHVQKPTYVDVVAHSSPDDKIIRVSILNRHPEADWPIELDFASGFDAKKVEALEMYSDDLDAANTFTKPDAVKPMSKSYKIQDWNKEKRKARKHSWTFLTFSQC